MEEEGAKSFECPKCKKGYSSKYTLNRHMLTHEDGKHVCRVCKKVFTRPDLLEKHKSSVHKLDGKLECPVCSREFDREDNLKRHMKLVHEKQATKAAETPSTSGEGKKPAKPRKRFQARQPAEEPTKQTSRIESTSA